MAGIDKTYTNSYKEYKELKDWAKNQIVKFNYGKKSISIHVINFIYDWNENDFTEELPVMNTPTWLDKYLYDNCKCKFVLDRLNETYPNKYLDNIKLGYIPKNFKQNRKVIITNDDRTLLPLTNKGLKLKCNWMLLEDKSTDFWYSDLLNAWVHNDSNFPNNTNTMFTNTTKSMIRRLRKMYLPSGLEFILVGRYVGEQFLVKIK